MCARTIPRDAFAQVGGIPQPRERCLGEFRAHLLVAPR